MTGCPGPGNDDPTDPPDTEEFTSAPDLTLEPENTKIVYTWTASNPAADSYDVYWKAGSGLTSAQVKTGTKITGATSGGTITGLTNGTAYSVVVVANKANYKSIDSDVATAIPAMVYKITGSGTSFTATRAGATIGTADQPIQTVIDAIKGDANETVCIIHFGDGVTALNIGTATASFNNTGGTWGSLVELTGKITGSATNSSATGTNGTIIIADTVSVTSTADIANTASGSNGRAIYFNSTGELTISGGTVSATTGNAVYNNNSTGAVTISGGTVKTTGNNGYAVQNQAGGTVNISGGTVKGPGSSVFNNSTGAINISGGTVEATTGVAVYNTANGKITVSGTANITSGSTSATSGTIYLASNATPGVRLEMTGGTVTNTSATTGNAINNASSGTVNINGGTVSKAGDGNYAVFNNNQYALITIGPGATIVGNKNW